MKEKQLYFFLLIGFFIILFLPLLNLPPWFAPPAWGKTIVFRSLIAILLFVILTKYSLNLQNIKELLNRKAKIFLPFWSLLVFFFTVFLSTLFSLDITHSLWGDPNRSGGFINFAFYVIFCILGFLIIRQNDWKKLLNFSLIIGILASLVAVFQKFGILNEILAYTGGRPSSLMGNPIIFSLYLLPLFFLSLSFFFSEKKRKEKVFYFFSLLFFLFTIIFITQTRAAFLGIIIGLFWFLLMYPKKSKLFRIAIISSSIFSIICFFFLNNNSQIYENWHPVFKTPVSRIMTLAKGFEAEPSRFSVWRISIEAFKEKPVLGYGPENFPVAFDKHYDPLLPRMSQVKTFDKAHNSLVEILITSGFFALLFYLLFVSSLFWQLQKIKKECPVSHGLQSAFLAFLTASFFSIEGFSTFFIFFFISAYSLHLISDKKEYLLVRKTKLLYFLIFLPLLVWFLLNFNLKPFQINTNINIAQNLADQRKWQESFEIFEKESEKKSFLLPYLNTIYSKTIINNFSKATEEEKINLSEKNAEILKENSKIQPYYTRNWFFLGQSLIILAEDKKDTELLEQARMAFEKTLELKPKDPSVLLASFLADVAAKDFKTAENKSTNCLKEYPELKECLWISGLINIYLNDIEKGKDFIEKAKEKKYSTESENSLNRLMEAFAENENYEEIVPLLQKLIKINPKQIQYKTSLLFVYGELKEYEKAEKLGLEIIKTNPELKTAVENFLKTLR